MTATTHPAGLVDGYPVSALQAGMFFHSLRDVRSPTYHDVFTMTVRSPFAEGPLRAALDDVAARHPVLRTSFELDRFSQPLQLVHETADIPLAVDDLSGAGPAAAARDVAAWREAEQHEPFDWATPPLLRVRAHVLPAGRFALSLSFHHAILDGWSVASLYTEILRRYHAHRTGAAPPAGPPAATFRDFVAQEREAVGSETTVAFWRDVVADTPTARLPRLPGYPAEPEPVNATVDEPVDPAVLAGLERAAAALRVPLRTVLLAAHLRVLALHAGRPDALAGVVVNGRPETEGGDAVLGLFLNSVPFTVDTDAPSWERLVRRVFEAELAVLEHRRLPLFEIQRAAGRSGLLDCVFDFRDFHVYRGLPDEVTVVGWDAIENTELPLRVSFFRGITGDALTLSVAYDRSQFSPAQIDALRAHHRTALALLAADPAADPRPTEPYLTAADTAAESDTGLPAGTTAPPSTVDSLIERQARRTPDAVAVTEGSDDISYAALVDRAGRLAARLAAAGAGPESVVGVHLPRSIDLVVAFLAVWRAGGAVLALDPDYPPARLATGIADADARILVTRTDLAGRLDAGTVLVVDDDADGASVPTVPHPPSSLACVISTSGSTGRPKTVMLTHDVLAAFAAWLPARFGLTPDDRVAFQTPTGFDLLLMELLAALTVGGRLVVTPTAVARDSDRFAAFITRHEVTFLVLVPSMLSLHVDAGVLADCPSLRTVTVGGEALPQSLVDGFAAQHPATLVNIYGPTEGIVLSSTHTTTPGRPGPGAPIGRPVAGTRLHVLDEAGRRQPVGVPGELYLGGPRLARGYRGRPALTAERFVPDHLSGDAGARLYRTGDIVRRLPDGTLEFLGRADGQVKVRGVRVELAEVEGAMRQHPDVRRAAAVVRQVPRSGSQLVGYVVWRGTPGGAGRALRRSLGERLPTAMVPTTVVELDELPLLPNGKVDRNALPEPDRAAGRDRYAEPRDMVESRLVALWEETLGAAPIGIDDDFFQLGGHSVLALRLSLRVRRAFDRELPLHVLLADPTVRGLAAFLRSPADLTPTGRIVSFRRGGTRPPLYLAHGLGGQVFRYRSLAARLGDDQPVHAITARGFADGETPHDSLAAMVRDYADDIRAHRPHGPYLLGGACVAGTIALEVARELTAAGEEVPLVVLLYTDPRHRVLADMADDTTLMMNALAGGPVDLDAAKLRELDPDERLLAVLDAAAAEGTLTPAAQDLAQARRILHVYRENARAIGGHRHHAYDGQVLLLMPSGDPDYTTAGDLGWGGLVTGGLHVGQTPGDRYTMLTEPLVARTAEILAGWCDRLVGP